jgi:hypothetical protein
MGRCLSLLFKLLNSLGNYWNFISCSIAVITATNIYSLSRWIRVRQPRVLEFDEPNPVTAVFDVGLVTLDLATPTHTAIVVWTPAERG